jgi:hypothetical protein
MRIVWPLVGMIIPLSLLALPVAFWLIKRSAVTRKPLTNAGALEFALAPGMRYLLGSVIVGLTAFSVLIFVYGMINGEGWYGVFIPLAVLVALLIATPGTVVLDQDGIRQRRRLLGDRKIAWDEVAWMKRGWRTDTTYVKSKKGGRPISFPRVLIGRSVFEREVRKHTCEGADLYE